MTHQNNEIDLTLPEINQGRARIYQWFSQQFQQELTEPQWQALVQGELAPFFDLLAENGLAPQVQNYLTAINHLANAADNKARLVLASDFAHAFLLSGTDSALPYAAAYDPDAQGMLYGAAAEIMKEFLEGAGLKLASNFKEPEDHLVIYLAVLSHMADATANINTPHALTEQQVFMDEALLPWLSQFVAKCQGVDLQSQVYPTLAKLLESFVLKDRDFLASIETAKSE